MVNTELLRETIDNSGISIIFIANKMGVFRESVYNKLSGTTKFKVSEITSISQALNLDDKKRNAIFLNKT